MGNHKIYDNFYFPLCCVFAELMSYVNFHFRFEKDDILIPLLKMCTMLDPRYKLVDNATKEKLVTCAVALGR